MFFWLIKTSPAIGCCTLEMVRNKVDFPIPFFPNSATNFPFEIDKLISEATIFDCFFCGYPIDKFSVFRTIFL